MFSRIFFLLLATTNKNSFLFVLTLVLMAGASGARADIVSFSDEDFLDSSWSTTVFLGGVGDLGTAQQDVGIGSPPPSRLVSLRVVEPGPASVGVFSLFTETLLTPDPVNGIEDVTISMSATHVSSIGGAGTAHFVFSAVQQSGVLFLGSSLGVVEGDVDKPLLFDSINESAFHRFDGLSGISIDTTAGVNPDFSAAGLPISVGFFSFRADSTAGGTDETHVVAYDNFHVVATSIPEPSPFVALLLFGSLRLNSRIRDKRQSRHKSGRRC